MNRFPMQRRRGTVFLIALWIIMILAGLVLVFANSMVVEATASANHVASLQAEAIERGAEQYVLALIDQNQPNQQVMALNLEPGFFSDIVVGDVENGQQGYFWIIRPNYGDESLPAFGLVDEASKINLNTATKEVLMGLPNITEDLVDALIDWRDTDETAQPLGAESDYYSTLPNPYLAKNGPLETVEELLLVKGWTRPVLYGEISEMNSGRYTGPAASGIASTPQMPSMSMGPISSKSSVIAQSIVSDWATYYGLYDYFTVYTHEATSSTSGATGAAGASRTASSGSQGVTAASATAKPTSGLININTAPRDVLYALGLDDSEVSTIMSYRQSADFDPTDISWVNQALPQKAATLTNMITGSAYQYSANIVAVSGNGRAFKHVRIVVDARTSPPQIVYRRDLTDRGWPMSPELLASLRSGTYTPSQTTIVSGGVR